MSFFRLRQVGIDFPAFFFFFCLLGRRKRRKGRKRGEGWGRVRRKEEGGGREEEVWRKREWAKGLCAIGGGFARCKSGLSKVFDPCNFLIFFFFCRK